MTQFYNALKYISKMTPAIVAISMKGKASDDTFWKCYLFAKIFSTMFVLIWDLYMDWGLFRGTKNKILRDNIKFPPKFYYTCMVLNTFFRFYWVLPLAVGTTQSDFIEKLEFFTFGSMLIEGMRRTFWSIIRIENESFNNFEMYRTIVSIPPLNMKEIEESKEKED